MLFPEPPPKGRGCWICAQGKPVVKLEVRTGFLPGPGSIRFSRQYALCFTCLAGWFPGWPDSRVADWLVRQAEQRVALEARKKKQGRQARFGWR